MEAPGTPRPSSTLRGLSARDRWILALTLAVALCGAAIRLAGIDEVGLKGSDNTYYTNIAKLWSEGDRVYAIGDSPTLYYRPVVYSVYAAAIGLLGFNDSAIKTANATLDTVNIALVFVLAFVLSRKKLAPAAAATVIYALLPYNILISRSELTHTLSASTLLMSMVFVALSLGAEDRPLRLSLALLGGAATGLSALTHEEMIFTAVAPLLLLLLASRPKADGARLDLRAGIGRASSYLAGVASVAHGMLWTHHADAQARAAVIIDHRISEAQYLRFVERPLKFAWNAVTGSTSTYFTCLVMLLALVLITRFLVDLAKRPAGRRFPRLLLMDLPLWTVIAYLALYSVFFTYYAVRLFAPLVPLLVVWLVVRITWLSDRRWGQLASGALLAALTVTVVIANLSHITTFRDSLTSRFETWAGFSVAEDLSPGAGWSTLRSELTTKTWARRRYEELGDVVAADSRLLVGASTFHPYPGRRLLQVGYYFGDNAVYLFDHDEPIDRLIQDQRIRFVLFTTYESEERSLALWGEHRRYRYNGRWSPRLPLTLGQSLGFDDGEYSVPREFERLRADMERRGARIILGWRDLLTRRPSFDDPVSFIVWTLDPASWPPLAHEIEAIEQGLELASQGRTEEALAVLDAAVTPECPDMGRFRLELTAARILAERGRQPAARQRTAEALDLLPRNTSVATAVREAYPTLAATDEMVGLFEDLQATKPRHRAVRDILLALELNRAELAIEAGESATSECAFHAIEQQLRIPGNPRYARDVADWCSATARALSEAGHRRAARAALAAASAAERKRRDRDARSEPARLTDPAGR